MFPSTLIIGNLHSDDPLWQFTIYNLFFDTSIMKFACHITIIFTLKIFKILVELVLFINQQKTMYFLQI